MALVRVATIPAGPQGGVGRCVQVTTESGGQVSMPVADVHVVHVPDNLGLYQRCYGRLMHIGAARQVEADAALTSEHHDRRSARVEPIRQRLQGDPARYRERGFE